MSWTKTIRTREVSQTEPLILDEGAFTLEVVKEPDRPVTTKYGEKLVYHVKQGNGEAKALFIPYREEASTDSAIGQLKALTEKYGSLVGRQLKMLVVGKSRFRRYSFSIVEQSKMKTK